VGNCPAQFNRLVRRPPGQEPNLLLYIFLLFFFLFTPKPPHQKKNNKGSGIPPNGPNPKKPQTNTHPQVNTPPPPPPTTRKGLSRSVSLFVSLPESPSFLGIPSPFLEALPSTCCASISFGEEILFVLGSGVFSPHPPWISRPRPARRCSPPLVFSLVVL